jgi:hypothetical protein
MSNDANTDAEADGTDVETETDAGAETETDAGAETETDVETETDAGAATDGGDGVDLSSTTLTQRLVLLGVIHTARQGGPVHSAAVVDAVVDHLDEIDADMVGSVNEAEAMRALNRLSAEGYLGEEIADASPAGKGRPTYALAVDERAVFEAFADDHRLDEVVAFVRDA